jgi:hypothetical protein
MRSRTRSIGLVTHTRRRESIRVQQVEGTVEGGAIMYRVAVRVSFTLLERFHE